MSIPQQATTQQLIDYAVTKLIEQGAPSILLSNLGGVSCLYRDSKGRACAIGQLIADEHYDEETLERRNISNEDVNRAVVASIGRELTHDDTAALQAVQDAHDRAADQAHRKDNKRLPFLIAFNDRLKDVVLPLSDEVRELAQEAADAESKAS